MKKSPTLLILFGVFGFVLIFGLFWMGAQSDNTAHKRSENHADHRAFDVASGDTNNEVLKNIVAQQKALQNKNEQQAARIKELQQENQEKTQKSLREQKVSLQQQIVETKDRLEAQFKKELNAIKQQPQSEPRDSDLEYTMGGENLSQSRKAHMIATVTDLSTRNDEEKNNFSVEKSQSSSPGQLSDVDASGLPSDHEQDTATNNKKSIPYYTLPDGSTLANATLLSPLIGEVPINGQLKAPAFPFKAVLSYRQTQDMLAANGVPIPHGIAGTVLQGYSVGDIHGCTRPYVMKILFVEGKKIF